MSVAIEDRSESARRGARRGRIGTMTAMSSLDDENYLEFVEGLRAFALKKMTPVAAKKLNQESAGRNLSLSEIQDIAYRIPVLAYRSRILESTQGMDWRRVLDSYNLIRDELEAELASYAGEGPGTVDIPTDWEYPEYYDSVHYHRQPGGYHDDKLAGHIYHYGTKVFHLGNNDHDETKIERIQELPEPADGSVRRTLDIACSIGAGTVAFKERWPEAEVWGIDASGPFIEYAHARAVQLNVDVNFSQQLAESLRFPDGHFDVVYMSTLLHELPVEIGRQAIREARRVMRPGATLLIHDMPPASNPIEPWNEFNRDFDARFNCEPYSLNFIHSKIDDLLAECFESVSVVPGHTMTWTCIA